MYYYGNSFGAPGMGCGYPGGVGFGGGYGYGFGGIAALILVLFILLVIIVGPRFGHTHNNCCC